MMDQVFKVESRDDGIAVITFEVPGESHNTLKAEFVDQANEVLDQLEQDAGIKGVVLISGKPDSFIAGADISMLQGCKNAQEAAELSRTGQRFCARLENFKAPVVAAIHGSCLGGGLELAMACHARVCSTGDKTVLGLPEVMLGLLPGSGGTQRLPRLVGIAAALDLMLTGRHIKPAKARALGLVDEVVLEAILLPAALKQVEKCQGKRTEQRRFSLGKWVLEGNPLGRKVVFQQARKQALAKTKGHYPAPLRIIDCVQAGASGDLNKGLEAESRYFGELAISPQARQLMNIYFATTAMKKDTGVADAAIQGRPIHRIGVLGAGLMGAGISYVSTAKAGLPVRLKDQEVAGLNRGMQYLHKRVQKRLKRRSLTPFQADLEMTRVTPSLDYSGFNKVDLVIEAVFEDLELKQQMVRDIETHCPEHTIFATNTSSIPITRIAQAAQHPQQIIGMHYFSPVEKMPLLEIIATPETAPEVIATAVDLGRKQGKTVIVVKDGSWFLCQSYPRALS